MRRAGRLVTGFALAGVLALAALGPVGTAVGAVPSAAPAAAPLPQDDPFYTPPAGWQGADPGTVFRSRPVQLAAFSALPQHVQAWQLLYRSTSGSGAPMPAVTTVLEPAGSRPTTLVSYQIAEDASAPQCAPSYELRAGDSYGEVVNQAEILLIDATLAAGHAVSVPDYEGPDGDFGAARQPGYAILDGIRAAEQFAPLGLPGAATPVGIWGYSGGSLASGWAAEVQPSYAAGLNVRGVAVGGYVTDLEQALLTINGGPESGLIASALPGVLRSDPALAALIEPHLTAAGAALLAQAGRQCEIANVSRYPFVDFSRYLDVPLASLLAQPAVAAQMSALNLGHTTPAVPMFVYHAVHDELVPVSGTDATVQRFCASGAAVTYTRDQLSEHGVLAVTGAPAALNWLGDRLAGAAAPSGCSTRTVLTMALLPSALPEWPTVLGGALLGLLDQPIGVF